MSHQGRHTKAKWEPYQEQNAGKKKKKRKRKTAVQKFSKMLTNKQTNQTYKQTKKKKLQNFHEEIFKIFLEIPYVDLNR